MTISKEKLLLGLIGCGIQGSLSPPLYEHEAGAQGLPCVYQLIDLDVLGLPATEAILGDLLTAAERMGFSGLNITHPCKQVVMGLLDEVSSQARQMGAVNTVVFRNGRRHGYNTDCPGFAESLQAGLPGARLERVLQLGAGGAGAATAHALLELGTRHLAIHDISPERAQGLSAALCARFGEGRAAACHELEQTIAQADGLVHCTPTGMAKHPGLPLPASLLHSRLWVADIVYCPIETALLRAAREIGCRTLPGGGMLVHQAAIAFIHFCGRPADAQRMHALFDQIQERKEKA